MTEQDRQPQDTTAATGEPVVSKPYVMPDDPEPGSIEALQKEAAEARDRMLRTLAEMEARLNRCRFLRISRSEIINLNKVSNFDFSLSGTIQVHFDDGSSTWVARRYVRAIQEILGLA